MSNPNFHTVATEILKNGSLRELFSDSGYKYTYLIGGPVGDPASMDVKIYALCVDEPVACLEALNGTNEILVTKMPTRVDLGLKELGKVARLMGMLTEELIAQVRGTVETVMYDGLSLQIHEDPDGGGDFLSLVDVKTPLVTVRLCESGVVIQPRRVQLAMRALMKLIKKEDNLLDRHTREDTNLGERNNSFWEDLRDWDFTDLACKLRDSCLHDRIVRENNNWKGISSLNKFDNEISDIRLPPVKWNPHVTVLTIDDYFRAVKVDHEVLGKI